MKEKTKMNVRCWKRYPKEDDELHKAIFDLNNTNDLIILSGVNESLVGKDKATGIFDNEDRELYEGDIIQYSLAFKGNIKYTLVVEIPDIYIDLSYDDFSPYNINRETVEIIGNIYENPDLCKEDN